MKITLFSKYSHLGASSRLRSFQYLPELERVGIQVAVKPLFDDNYLRRLYKGDGRSLVALMNRYSARMLDMYRASSSDLIWMEKEALPYFSARIESNLMPKGIPYVVDYDDAVFHNYDSSPSWSIKLLLGKKIDRVMAGAAVVICGNEYLAARAQRAGAKSIRILPTVVDAVRYTSTPASTEHTSPVIGWIGSPSTQHYVLELREVFKSLFKTHNIRLLLVGAQPKLAVQFGEVPVEVLTWTEATEAQNVARFDIGIMPLSDDKWERGKCGYKIIQYMACSKPVVASPVGVNVDILLRSGCGYLATGNDQWIHALTKFLDCSGRRVEFGKKGRLAVESYYSLQIQARRLAEILREAAG